MISRIRYFIDKFMLWKRIGIRRCEICHRLCLIQHEVGLGYWTCGRDPCVEQAIKLYEADIENWINPELKTKIEDIIKDGIKVETNVLEHK